MKSWTVVVLGAAVLLGGCDRGGAHPKSLTAEVDYPVAHFDLQARVAVDQADEAVRQLAARVADTDGVALTEADYAGHVVRVALLPGAAANSERISVALRGLTGVTAVEPAR